MVAIFETNTGSSPGEEKANRRHPQIIDHGHLGLRYGTENVTDAALPEKLGEETAVACRGRQI